MEAKQKTWTFPPIWQEQEGTSLSHAGVVSYEGQVKQKVYVGSGVS